MSDLLNLSGVTKTFGGLVAVNDVSFSVEQGSVMGIIGPNGAGKTTVFNLITGNYTPDRGEILFRGQSLVGRKPHCIVDMGIARTFQSIRLFPSLPVLENVLAGRHCRMSSGMLASMFRTPAQRREEKEARERAMSELEFVGLAECHDEEAGSLSYGNQRLLEMARVFKIPALRRIRCIDLPQVMPYFRAGCTLGLGLCWKAGVAAEVIGMPVPSIGERLQQAKVYLDTPELFAWTLVIVLMSVGFEKLFMAALGALERRLTRL